MYVLVHLLNIVGGFILAAPLIGKVEAMKETSDKIHKGLLPYQMVIGILEVIAGVLTLINQFGYSYIPYFYGGFLTAIFAIVMGLLLAQEQFKKFPGAQGLVETVRPYGEYIGAVGLVIGITHLF